MSVCPHCGNDVEQELRVTVDVGPHLSHLFKRLFPKAQQGDVDTLVEKLKTSEESLKSAVEATE